MVNGNYTVYGDRPVSDSEIVEDHVHTRTAERKVKRKPNRTANELQHTLSLAQIDNETDSIKYEKRVKEPRLLRYVPTTDVEENYISEKFETYDMKPTEERPRRYAFTKKPKNPADGSVNYAYSRSSSSCSSPNGNLPTISEHGEHYGTYRVRTTSPHISEVIPTYENKLEKYFAKPREVKKFAAKGSHPDSLYRVPVDDEIGSSKLVRALRVMRWPAALVLVCVALAVFVYFLMPDNLDSDQDKVNSTHWQSDPVAVEAVHFKRPFVTEASMEAPTKAPRHRKKGNHQSSNLNPKGTKISEIDFYNPVNDNNEVTSTATSAPLIPTRKLPVPPVFPSHITPEVQYGNEKADIDNLRAPKVLDEKLSQEDSTLKPHITQKPEKPLAISFKDAITITSPSTETIFKAETNNDLINYGEKYTTIVDEAPNKSQLPIYKDQLPLYIQEHKSSVSNKQQQVFRGPEDPKYGQQLLESDVNFTSGHSKIFGLSIEDAGKMRSTTQSSLYNTRVSPTLPTWKNRDDTTTKKYPINVNSEGPLCRSTRLALCRGVLPYDLAGAPVRLDNVEVTLLLPQLEYLAATNCSRRLREFACSLLEPECSPFPNPAQLPCQSLCRAIVDSCGGLIPHELGALFNCDQYGRSDCVSAKAPCHQREFPCADGSCMPRDWICDGNQDCPNGEDESQCALCVLNEFKCRSGGCILKRWLCDGYDDCPGGEDETAEVCEIHHHGETVRARGEPGEHAAASAPAPAVRRPSRMPTKHWIGDHDSSKELLITSDSNNAFKRNFTRRPSPSRLTPYSRPMLKTTTTTLRPKKPIEETEDITTTGIHLQNKIEPNKSKTNDSNEDVEIGDIFIEEPKVDNAEKKITKVPEPRGYQMKKTAKSEMAPSQADEPVNTRIDKASNTLNRVLNGADLMKQAKDVELEAASESLETNSTFMEKDELPSFSGIPAESLSSHVSPCPNGELRCVDGRCITIDQLCDGTIDCSDHADEDNCYA